MWLDSAAQRRYVMDGMTEMACFLRKNKDLSIENSLRLVDCTLAPLMAFSGPVITWPEKEFKKLQESDGRFAMGHLQCCPVVFDAYGFPRMFALQAGWVQMELCREMAVAFLFIADGALSVHHGKIHAPGFLPIEVVRRVAIRVSCLIHSL